MNYTRPALTLLGNAIHMVQFGSPYKNPAGVPEGCDVNGICPPFEVDD